MIGCPSSLMVNIENDTTISPVVPSFQRSQMPATVNGSPRYTTRWNELPIAK
jgi:hypothetical protein